MAPFSGYTHTEIADLLDLPLSTVRGRMRRGSKRAKPTSTRGTAGSLFSSCEPPLRTSREEPDGETAASRSSLG
jgi:hypothetical protein